MYFLNGLVHLQFWNSPFSVLGISGCEFEDFPAISKDPPGQTARKVSSADMTT